MKGEPTSGAAEIEDRIYNLKDFDRTLVIDERTQRVARKDHRLPQAKRRPLPEDHRLLRRHRARRARMRQALINENADLVRAEPRAT
jgi:type I restriction enzyme R subunit